MIPIDGLQAEGMERIAMSQEERDAMTPGANVVLAPGRARLEAHRPSSRRAVLRKVPALRAVVPVRQHQAAPPAFRAARPGSRQLPRPLAAQQPAEVRLPHFGHRRPSNGAPSARSRILRTSPGSRLTSRINSAARSSTSASPDRLPAGNRSPRVRSARGNAPTGLATTRHPAAIASTTVIPNGSCRVCICIRKALRLYCAARSRWLISPPYKMHGSSRRHRLVSAAPQPLPPKYCRRKRASFRRSRRSDLASGSRPFEGWLV